MRWGSKVLLAGVCLISGSMWLLPQSNTDLASELCLLALAMVLATTFIGAVVVRRFGLSTVGQSRSRSLVFSGIGSLGAPALLFFLGRQELSSVMAVAVQANGLLLVALATSLTADEGGSQPRLGPGLIALAGVLLVFPVALPASMHGWIGFCLYLGATCLSGISSVVCHREMVRAPVGYSLFLVAAGNALFLLVSAAAWMTVTSQWHSLAITLSASGAVVIALTAASLSGVIYLFRLVSPLAVASRFVLTPLISALEAYVLLRPTLSFREVAGAALMFVGGIACTRQDPERDSAASMSLR